MPGEQYLALARATKRPMRRWWLAVGSWWLGGASILLAIQAILAWYESQIGAALPGNTPAWLQLLTGAVWLIVPLAFAAALLCSHKITTLVSQLSELTPMQGSQETSVYSLYLSILNSWPSIIPVALTWAIWKFLPGFQDVKGLQHEWLGFLVGLDYALLLAGLMLWVFVLVVLPKAPRWISWLFFFCAIAASGLHNALSLGIPNLAAMFPAYQWIDLSAVYSQAGSGAMALLGLAGLYSMVYLFCLGKTRQATALAVFICAHLYLANNSVGFGVYAIDLFIQSGRFYGYGLQPISFWYYWLGSEMWVYVFEARVEYKVPFALSIVPPLARAGWLALHFYLLSWMIRKVKPLKPGKK